MVMVAVFLALLTTCLANLGTQCADLFCKRRIGLHGLYRENANVRALPVRPDAISHHLDILFTQAGVITRVARLHARNASFDTLFVHLVFHSSTSFFSVTPESFI